LLNNVESKNIDQQSNISNSNEINKDLKTFSDDDLKREWFNLQKMRKNLNLS